MLLKREPSGLIRNRSQSLFSVRALKTIQPLLRTSATSCASFAPTEPALIEAIILDTKRNETSLAELGIRAISFDEPPCIGFKDLR